MSSLRRWSQQVAELRRESQALGRLQNVPSVIRAYTLESYGNGNVALALESFGRSIVDQIAAEGRRTLPLTRALSLEVAVGSKLQSQYSPVFGSRSSP
jgi:hypothetical protein